MTAALEGGEWSAARPGRTLLPGKTRYPFYRKLGGPQGRFGRAENLVPTGIRSRTVQPVVSRYTDWATRPTIRRKGRLYYMADEKKTEGGDIRSFCRGRHRKALNFVISSIIIHTKRCVPQYTSEVYYLLPHLCLHKVVKNFKFLEISAFCGMLSSHRIVSYRIVSARREHIVIVSSSVCEIPFETRSWSRIVS